MAPDETVDVSSFESEKGEVADRYLEEGWRLMDLKNDLLSESGIDESNERVKLVVQQLEQAAEAWGLEAKKDPSKFEKAVQRYKNRVGRQEKRAERRGETTKEPGFDYFSGFEADPDSPEGKRAVLRMDVNEFFLDDVKVSETVTDMIKHAPPVAPAHLTSDTDAVMRNMAIDIVFRPFPHIVRNLKLDLSNPKNSPAYAKAMKFLENIRGLLEKEYKLMAQLRDLSEDVETEQLIEGAESKFKNIAKEVIDNPGKSLLLAGGLILSLTALYKWGGKWGKGFVKGLGITAAVAGGVTATAFGVDWVMKSASDDKTGLFDRLGFNPMTYKESAALKRFAHLFPEMGELNEQSMRDLIRIGDTPVGHALDEFDTALTNGTYGISPLAFDIKHNKESSMDAETIYKSIREMVLVAAKRAGKSGDEYAGMEYIRSEYGEDLPVFAVLAKLHNRGSVNTDDALPGLGGLENPATPTERARAAEVRALFHTFGGLENTDVTPAGISSTRENGQMSGMMYINGYPLAYDYQFDERTKKGVHVFKDKIAIPGVDEEPPWTLRAGPNVSVVAEAIIEGIEKRMQARFKASKDLLGKKGPSGATVEYNFDTHQWGLQPPWELQGDTHIKNSYAGDGERYVDLAIFPNPEHETLTIMYGGIEYASFDKVKDVVEYDSIHRKVTADMGHMLGAFVIKDVAPTSAQSVVNIEYGKTHKVKGTITYKSGSVDSYKLTVTPELEDAWKEMAETRAQTLMNNKATLQTIARLSSTFQGATNTPSITSWQGFKEWGYRFLGRVRGSAPINMSHEQMWVDQVLHHMDELEVMAKYKFYQKMANGADGTGTNPKYLATDVDQDMNFAGSGIAADFNAELGQLQSVAASISSAGLTVGTVDFQRFVETKYLRERNWTNPKYKSFMDYVDSYMDTHDATGQAGLSTDREVRQHLLLKIFDMAQPIPTLAPLPGTAPAAPAAGAKARQAYEAYMKLKAQHDNADKWMSMVNTILPNLLDTAEKAAAGNGLFGLDRRWDQAGINKVFADAGVVSFTDFDAATHYPGGGVMNFAAAPTPVAPGTHTVTPPTLPGLPSIKKLGAWLTGGGAPSALPTGRSEFYQWHEFEIDTVKYWNTSIVGTAWNTHYLTTMKQRAGDIDSLGGGDDKYYEHLAYYLMMERSLYDALKMRGLKPSDIPGGANGLWTDVVEKAYKKHFPLYNTTGGTSPTLSPTLPTGNPTPAKLAAYKKDLFDNLDALLPPEATAVAQFNVWFAHNNDIVTYMDAGNIMDAMKWQNIFNHSVESRLEQMKAKYTNPTDLENNLKDFRKYIMVEKTMFWKAIVASGTGPGHGFLSDTMGLDVKEDVIDPLHDKFYWHFYKGAGTGGTATYPRSHVDLVDYEEACENITGPTF